MDVALVFVGRGVRNLFILFNLDCLHNELLAAQLKLLFKLWNIFLIVFLDSTMWNVVLFGILQLTM